MIIYKYIFISIYKFSKYITYANPELKAWVLYSFLLTSNLIVITTFAFNEIFKHNLQWNILMYLLIFLAILFINYQKFIKDDKFSKLEDFFSSSRIKLFKDILVLAYVIASFASMFVVF